MSNYSSVKIYFNGSLKQLEKIKELVVTEGQHGQKVIDFSSIKSMLPSFK